MRRTFLLVAGVCLAGSVARAQDPAKVDPQHCNLPDGTTKEVEAKAGQTSWNEPQKHSAENLSGSATENIQVELKGRAHAPTKKK